MLLISLKESCKFPSNETETLIRKEGGSSHLDWDEFGGETFGKFTLKLY